MVEQPRTEFEYAVGVLQIFGVNACFDIVFHRVGRSFIHLVEDLIKLFGKPLNVGIEWRNVEILVVLPLKRIPNQEAQIVEVQLIVNIVFASREEWQRLAVKMLVHHGERAPNASVGHDVLKITHHGKHHGLAFAVRQVGESATIVPTLGEACGQKHIVFFSLGHLLGVGLHTHKFFSRNFHIFGVEIVYLSSITTKITILK